MSRELLNIKQVRDMLHLSERTIFRLIKSGDLSGLKVGREWRFEQSDIDTYLDRQREKARQKPEEEAA